MAALLSALARGGRILGGLAIVIGLGAVPAPALDIETADEIGLYDDRPAVARARDAIAVVERFAAQMKASGDVRRAEEINRKLAGWKEGLSSKKAASDKSQTAEAEPEVHMISVMRGRPVPLAKPGEVDVQVTYTAKPIILVLSSFDATRWNVRRAPDVRIKSVLLAAHGASSVTGLAEGTPVSGIEASGANALPGVSDRYLPLLRRRASARIHMLTGQVPLTIISQLEEEGWKGEPLVLGPENADWRAQRAAAFLAPLRAEAEHVQRVANAKKLEKLRFELLYRVRRSGYRGGSPATSLGEMSIYGPVVDTLWPISSKLRHLTRDPGGSLYALEDRQAVAVDTAGPTYQPLLNEGEPAELGDARTMAFHAAAKKLFVWGEYVYAYDPAAQTWNVGEPTGVSPQPYIGAAAYLPGAGAMYGAQVEIRPCDHAKGDATSVISRLVKFDDNGKAVQSTPLEQEIVTNGHSGDAGIEMAAAGDYLAIIRSTIQQYDYDTTGRMPARLFLLEPSTGKIVWTTLLAVSAAAVADEPAGGAAGTVESIDDEGFAEKQIGSQITGFIGPRMAEMRSTGERLRDRFEKIEAATKKLAVSDKAAAEKMAVELNDLRSSVTPAKVQFPPRDDLPELHLVFLYEGRKTPLKKFTEGEARVTYTGRPIVLGLLSYYPVQWTLKADKGVRIEKILLSSYERPGDIVGLDDLETKPSIERFSRDSNELRHLYPDRTRLESATVAMSQLRQATGANDIATLIGDSNKYKGPVEVGPGNSDWRTQYVFYHSKPLFERAMRPELAKRWKELSCLRFYAIHHTPGEGRAFGGDGGNRSLAKFTPFGPIADSIVPPEHSLRNVAVDPESGTLYGVGRSGIFTVNPDTGACKPIDLVLGDAALDKAAAIAFDSKRKRVMVWSKERLHYYDPGTSKWTNRRHSGQNLMSAVYCPEEDMIYAADASEEENSVKEAQTISRINANGALIDRIPLSHRIWLGYYDDISAQLGMDRNKLVLIVPGGSRDDRRSEPRGPVCYTIDRKSGQVVWATAATAVRVKDE